MQEFMDYHMNQTVEKLLSKNWNNEEFYKEFLTQSYFYVFHSCRLLAYAASKTNQNQNSFYKRCIAHISEEEGHEVIALQNYKILGGDKSIIKERDFTRALWEPQYYKINENPLSLLGYILALEYLPFKAFKELTDIIEAKYGKSATSFVRIHAEEDPGHVDSCLQEIAKLSDDEIDLVMINYSQTSKAYSNFLDGCFNKEPLHYLNHHEQNQQAQL